MTQHYKGIEIRCPTHEQTDLKPGEKPLPGCGSSNVSEPDPGDGTYDCFDCGIFFTAEEGIAWAVLSPL